MFVNFDDECLELGGGRQGEVVHFHVPKYIP